MTLNADTVEAVLKSAWPDARLATAPVPLTGGQWASMARLAVHGAPNGVPQDLVLRVMPDAALGAKEVAVQREVATAGLPTPAIRLSGPADGRLRGAWAVMDFTAGTPLLTDLDGPAAIRALPRIAARIPRRLAEAMAALHRIDPRPVVGRVRDAAPTTAFTLEELWTHLHAGAKQSGESSLIQAVTALAATQPNQAASVICHGDLHPLNVLTDSSAGSGNVTVIDWTGALLAPPGYDVAFTWLLLRYPPLQAPAVLRPVIGAAARLLARAFVARYRAANPCAQLDGLGWYAALHAARILIELTVWQREQDPRVRTHPWNLIAPDAAAILSRASGIAIPRPPSS